MKIWTGFDSEHSYRLVLIGRFAEERQARALEQRFAQLQELASEEADDSWDEDAGFSERLYERLRGLKIWNLSRSEIDGFRYLDRLERDGATVTITTDDAELQGLLKLLFDHGARVEIYSSQSWTEEGEPREQADEKAGDEAEGTETARSTSESADA